MPVRVKIIIYWAWGIMPDICLFTVFIRWGRKKAEGEVFR